MLKRKNSRTVSVLYVSLCVLLVFSAVFSFLYALHLEEELRGLEKKIEVLETKRQETLKDKLDKMIKNMEKD